MSKDADDGVVPEKQALELDKLRQEVRSLRTNLWITRGLALILPIAAAVIGWAQYEQAQQKRTSDERRQLAGDSPQGGRGQFEAMNRFQPTSAARLLIFRPDPKCLRRGSSVFGGSDVIAAEMEPVADLIVG